MGWTTYTARRSLAFNHFAETAYTLELELTAFESKSADIVHEEKSISGIVERQFYGQEKIWQVTLAPVLDSESELLREFIDSTADGQTFSFDPSGSAAAPSRRRMLVVRADEGATETCFIGNGSDEGMAQFAFSVRQV